MTVTELSSLPEPQEGDTMIAEDGTRRYAMPGGYWAYGYKQAAKSWAVTASSKSLASSLETDPKHKEAPAT